MLKKTLFTLLVLFGIYNVWLWTGTRKMFPQYPKQAQLIQLEDYLYEKGSVPAVIVGSSMAAVLQTRFLGKKIHNLSVGGATIFEGLNLIRRAETRPRLLLVETNTLFNKPRPEIVEELFRPGLHQARRYLPGLREKNQPVGHIGRRTYKSLMVRFYEMFYAPSKKQAPAANPGAPAAKPVASKKNTSKKATDVMARPAHIPAEIFERNLKIYSRPPGDAHGERRARELKSILTILESRGTRVIFVEIPMHCAFEATELRKYTRSLLKRWFSPGKYTYWESNACETFGSNDGLHLDPLSGYKFALRLRTRILEELK